MISAATRLLGAIGLLLRRAWALPVYVVSVVFFLVALYRAFVLANAAGRVRIDLNKGEANILISAEEVKQRHADLKAKGGFPFPSNQTPWQEIYRNTVGQQDTGACLELATRYHNIAVTIGVARDNH